MTTESLERAPARSSPRSGGPSESPVAWDRIAVYGVLALVLVLRLAQLLSALGSPLAYQPGPDEDYYRRFALAVASGHGQDSPEFTFMDPAYGYVLGTLFKVFGPNLFVVYLLQSLLDTATAFGIVRVGRLLDRPRAGLLGALIYGITATAIMFCTTFLKETWVVAWLTWWVVAALSVMRSKSRWAWLALGVYTGLGVGFRSTLLMLTPLALWLPLWRGRTAAPAGVAADAGSRDWAAAALVAFGVLIALLPWSLRNDSAYGSLSPLPHNGGIVLQQIYNDQNPTAELWIAPFVSYLHPSEIWRGYAAEATRRLGRPLSPAEVDRYWHEQAMAFIEQHPGRVLGDIARKSLGFLSNDELANNRSDREERMFSPVLGALPPPAPLLLGLGLAGLLWLALSDRRWPIVAAPVLLAWFTMAVFFAESRFRFHAASMLALGAGIWMDQVLRLVRSRRTQVAAFAGLAVALGAVSLTLGWRTPPLPIRWDRIAWGYINMGRIPQAHMLAARIASEQPENGAIFEALGFTDIAAQQYSDAAEALRRAVELRPRSHVAHYNLARVYLALGDREHAAQEAAVAVGLYPDPDYRALVAQIAAGS